MNKVKIKIITIGHLPLHLNIKNIKKWCSDLFDITDEIENYALRCDSDCYGWVFSDELLKTQLPVNFHADFLLAIVNVPIEYNWYSRRLGDNRVVFSYHEIKEYLLYENIPLENAILRVLYAYTLLYRRSGNRIPALSENTGFTHDETRGCLFDMNGIKSDLIESCNHPIICDECEERLRNERVSRETIKIAKKEIKKIEKQLYYKSVDFIKRHPIIALCLSSLFAISISIISSFIYDIIKLH